MWSVDAQAVLKAHPSTPNDAVRSIGVRLRAVEPGVLEFGYSMSAEMSRVCVPSTDLGVRTDALWRHTCFEAFVAPADGAAYYEFNFSPSLNWAAYRFTAYRDGMSTVEINRGLEITVRRGHDDLELTSTVRLGQVNDLRDAHRWRIALAAVIEDKNGRLSYWGLRHPPGKPDFHHATGFAMEVARS